jgi:hypothetical protein
MVGIRWEAEKGVGMCWRWMDSKIDLQSAALDLLKLVRYNYRCSYRRNHTG